MSSSSSLEKFLFGALLGGAIGAVLGLLLAPKSGEETRATLKTTTKDKYRDAVDKALHGYDKSVVSIRDKYESSVETLKEASHSLKQWAEELSADLEHLGRRTLQTLKKDEPLAANGNGAQHSQEESYSEQDEQSNSTYQEHQI